MKKSIFFTVLMGVGIFTMGVSFAAETAAEKSTDKKSAVLESSKDPSEEKAAKVTESASSKAVAEAQSAPIAAVSSDIKEEIPQAAKDTYEVSSAGKTAEPSSSLNSAEMQRRWKDLFSKEITPGSVSYTVKPGDSLYVIALKNHTTVDLIKQINGLKSDSIYPLMKLKLHTAPFSIEIDKSKNILVLYSNGEAVKGYSVATGKKNCTPVGEFKITDKLVHPTWFRTGAILPPGSPENALGTRWMGFNKPGYGIHGTIEPKSIGTQASEGCIRMLNNEVEELYSIVPVGTKVTIQD